MKASTTALTAILLVATPVCLAGEAKWEKAKEKKGVTVWTRPVEGSPYLDVKGTGSVDATLSEVFEFLDDPQNMKKLSGSVKEVKALGSCGEGCTYIYERVGQKPVQDRHYVLEMRHEAKGEGTCRFWWKVSKKKKPQGTGAVEVTKHDGSWHISEKDGKTRIVYRNYMDVGGNIPVAFANMGVVNGAIDFFVNLRKHVG